MQIRDLINYEYERTSTVNQERLKFNGANYANYNFDDANRLTNIVNSADSSTISFGYDNADRLTSRTFPNGVSTTYGYDNMSRLKLIRDTSPSGTLFDRQYGYNSASQINQITEPTLTKTIGYDFVNRLTGVTASNSQNESYNFDDVGNRTSSHKSASYGYQPFNKVITTATANYVYDANGNMVSKAEGMNFWRYGFDYENRLVSASTRKQTVRYRYDALGRRVQRFTVGGKENTKFIYDGQDVLVDDNSGTLTKYINGAGIDNKLRAQTGSTVNYFLADHLGSTNGLTDASGNLSASTSYDAFGNAINAAFPSRYQFTGREHDNFTGLHYYRARFYDGNLGRFISEDPIGFAGGDVNLYGYVNSNSINRKDPLGLFDPGILGAGAGTAATVGGGVTLGGVAAVGGVVVGGFAVGYAIGYYPGQWIARYRFPEQFPDTEACPTTKPKAEPKPIPVPVPTPMLKPNPTPDDRPDRRFVCQFQYSDGILCHYLCTNSSGQSFPYARLSSEYGGNCPKVVTFP